MGKEIIAVFIHSFVPGLTNISNFSTMVAFTPEGPGKRLTKFPLLPNQKQLLVSLAVC